MKWRQRYGKWWKPQVRVCARVETKEMCLCDYRWNLDFHSTLAWLFVSLVFVTNCVVSSISISVASNSLSFSNRAFLLLHHAHVHYLHVLAINCRGARRQGHSRKCVPQHRREGGVLFAGSSGRRALRQDIHRYAHKPSLYVISSRVKCSRVRGAYTNLHIYLHMSM